MMFIYRSVCLSLKFELKSSHRQTNAVFTLSKAKKREKWEEIVFFSFFFSLFVSVSTTSKQAKADEMLRNFVIGTLFKPGEPLSALKIASVRVFPPFFPRDVNKLPVEQPVDANQAKKVLSLDGGGKN